MFEPKKELTPEAEKRLEALKEFSDLGSGFRIAMRDLSIRGAGDILGAEQSGFIESVGIETYMQILKEEIDASKNDKVVEANPVERDSSLNKVYASRHIDEEYIKNDDVRIEIHKKIDKVKSFKDLTDLSMELVDRFGTFSTELELYMYEKLFKNLCDLIGICKIEDNFKLMTLYISEEVSKTLDGTKLFLGAHDISDRLKLRYTNGMVQILFDKLGYKDNSYFKILDKYLDSIINS
jgi:transcription-repair coupling factor (superfamily II helicase)